MRIEPDPSRTIVLNYGSKLNNYINSFLSWKCDHKLWKKAWDFVKNHESEGLIDNMIETMTLYIDL